MPTYKRGPYAKRKPESKPIKPDRTARIRILLFAGTVLFATGFLTGHEHPRIEVREVLAIQQVPTFLPSPDTPSGRAIQFKLASAIPMSALDSDVPQPSELGKLPPHTPKVPK